MTPPDIAPPPATCPLVAPFLPSLSPTVPTGPSPGLPLAAPSTAPIISPQTTPGFLGARTLSPAGAKPTAESTDASTPRLNSLGLHTAALADLPREIPEWKQRQNSKGRKFAKRSLQLAGVGVAEGEGFGSAASVTRLAISLPTFETALPIDILDFVILSENDDTGSGLCLIDDVALFEPIPQARIGWITGSLAGRSTRQSPRRRSSVSPTKCLKKRAPDKSWSASSEALTGSEHGSPCRHPPPGPRRPTSLSMRQTGPAPSWLRRSADLALPANEFTIDLGDRANTTERHRALHP